MGYSKKYPHIPHERHWKSCKKCSLSMTGNPQVSPNFVNFNRNSRKTIQIFAKFWNSARFLISRLWNPADTAVVLLGNPEYLGTQFGVVHSGGGGGVFTGIAQYQAQNPFKITKNQSEELF